MSPTERLWNHDLSAYQNLPKNWRVVSLPTPRPEPDPRPPKEES